jgi:pantoate--beta-alanine ligase
VRLITTVEGFSKELESERSGGRSVGLVPTMGYLHGGHLSLIARARSECDTVAATIFVNPLQFGPGEDLDDYPRDLDSDLLVLGRAGADIAFAPTVREMYPEEPLARVRVEGLSEDLEGRSRPGHLEGVATVVAKLFAMAGRCRAYFGEKDYQQLLLVERLVSDLSFPVEVVRCPTVREPDGLAVSSRNSRLGDGERRTAAALYRALEAGRERVEAGERSPERVREAMVSVLAAEPGAVLDYAEVAGASDLSVPCALGDRELRLLVAATVGPVRLIDNLGVTPPGSAAAARNPGSRARDHTSDEPAARPAGGRKAAP